MTKLIKFKNAGKLFRNTKIRMHKNSPEILVVVGIAGFAGTIVAACKGTTKVHEIMEDHNSDMEIIRTGAENGEIEGTEYTEEDAKKDTAITYVHTGVKVVKAYAPAVLLGAVTVGCFLTSHNILRKRNVALAAAYTAVDKGFKEYRGRVIDRFGEEIDRELKYNIKAKKITETVVDEETGKEKKIKKTVDVVEGPLGYSPYAKFFDEACRAWEKDAEANLYFLRAQQKIANDKLEADGFLFLNDVYDMLGIPRTKAGKEVGWVYNEKNPVGDNRVDFGMYDVNREEVRDFVNGYERVILLDFNVDGPIDYILNNY